MMKRFVIGVFLLIGISAVAQHQKILYGFNKIPQTLLLNPGGEIDYKYHIGVPALSGVNTNVNVSGLTVADLFRDDNIDFTTKLIGVVDNLGDNDYAAINTQIEILNAGYRLNDKTYISGGFYTEIDAFFSIPKDLLLLARDGNSAYLNRSFLISKINVKADALTVLHAGVSRKINEKMTVGARLKIYSGLLNLTSTGNQGSFRTRLGANSVYEHILSNLDASVQSSGFYNTDNEFDVDGNSIRSNAFLGSNMGLGLDIGFTYHANEQTEFTASILDFGYIGYKDKLRNATIQGDYVFSGIEFQYENNQVNPDYWQDLNDDLDEAIDEEENKDEYSVMRPIKLNASVKHSFGKSRREENCTDMMYNDYFDNAVGAQLHSTFRPIGPRFALTGFYERRLAKKINTKVTYTIDDFSYANFGLGISADIWKINVYGLVDNVFKLSDIADASTASVQFGLNVVFD